MYVMSTPPALRRHSRPALVAAAVFLAMAAGIQAQPRGTMAEAIAPHAGTEGYVTPRAASRPRVGLVLGGGAAWALSHIGVLQVLEQLRVPVDCIAGTSIGAFVGGLYASGMASARIAQVVADIDWVRLSGGDFSLLMRGLVRPVDGIEQLDQLPIPFTAVATDLETGEASWLHRGPLSQAMRASFSITGRIPPYRFGGRLLANGGLVDILPVNAARQLCGAEVLVVVDIGTPTLPRENLMTFAGLSTQIASLLTQQNALRQLASLAPHDVLIRPELYGLTDYDFYMSKEVIAGGRQAALKLAARLQPLAMSVQDYHDHLAARAARAPQRPERLVAPR
jgi:NTE family protein